MRSFILFVFFLCGFFGFSQVGIGVVKPDSSAQLDVFSSDKGVLLPRVALSGIDDQTTITNGNKDGLLIYNIVKVTGVNGVVPGFYYWSQAQLKWIGIGIDNNGVLNLKVDKIAGKGLSTEDFTKAEKTKLANQSGTNTGDQDLSGLATTTALNLKVDKIAGKGLSTEDFTTAEKTKLTNLSGTNTGDQDLSGLATTTAAVPDATTGSKGIVQLSGDLTRTATAPLMGNNKVTYSKIQNVSATDKVLGRISAGAGIVEEIATTGSGDVVRVTSPTLVTPNLGTPTTLVGTNITGTGMGFTAGTAIIANTVSSVDEAADTTCFPLFITASGTQTLQTKNSTSLIFNSVIGNLGASSFTTPGLVTASGFLGTTGSSYAQAAVASTLGNISLNLGAIDSPGIHFYAGTNANWGIDNPGGTLRFVKNLDEAGGTISMNIDATENVNMSRNLNVMGDVTKKEYFVDCYYFGNQNIAINVYRPLLFNNESVNVNFQTRVSHTQFQPPRAGYWMVSYNLSFEPNMQGSRAAFIRRNSDMNVSYGMQYLPLVGADVVGLSGSAVIYFNGTSDYVEICAFQSSGTSLNVGA